MDDIDINCITPVEVDNNQTSLVPDVRHRVEHQVMSELSEGHYVETKMKPTITSALSALSKPDGGIRLIHDYSRPEGLAVNDYATKYPFQCQSISDAIQLIQPGYFLAKVDLHAAYRSVGLHPSQFPLTGLKWTFSGESEPRYFMDTRLPFGARQSPYIFHRLTQAVRRMLEKRNIQLVVFLDDFLIIAKDFNECIHGYNKLISLLRELGFSISWKKVCDPTTKLTFLGVCIDTVAGTLSLEQTKVDDLCDQIKLFCARRRASRRQLESLADKLVWVSHVIPWSRLHLRTLLVWASHVIPWNRLHLRTLLVLFHGAGYTYAPC